ncbi:hypothetical protein [Pseudogemmobacter humi]|uniref:Lipoprotein n=1 Tax=Pseudogemmobacter humi TaxID=2483812 RepID=A0A3P5X802_9RHOB|nr:hypothetical protein [Pseudogemmobacter humi]VDC30784.1 hypothetical protein XINFAN_02688 [Pseudogemmobacter humi]
MIRPVAVLCLAFSLAACGAVRDSRLNPFNWFGRSEPVQQAELPEMPQDGRQRVESVLSLTVEPIRSGAIVRATGRTPSQGWWKAELVEQPVTADGVLVLDFRIEPPPEQTAVSTPRSREVTVALHLSQVKLAGVRQIVVQGANDARAAGR